MSSTSVRVVIVDDNADSARMLKLLLQKEGQEARVAFDGPAAIAAAGAQKPDLVLLDLSLPGMSGLEVAAELRRNPDLAECVLVAISGHAVESVPSPSPFDAYFTKPVDFAALLAYVGKIQCRRNPSSWEPAVA
jgi:CheY-like chemotaxis protein